MGNKRERTAAARRDDRGNTFVAQQEINEIDTPVLPPPEVLERIEKIHPGMIDWIMTETSKEAESRRKLESRRMDTVCLALTRGQHYGLIMGIVGTVSGAVVAICGQPVVGGTIVSVTVAVLAFAFLTGRSAK